MASPTLFAVPVPSQTVRSSRFSNHQVRKRKRNTQLGQDDEIEIATVASSSDESDVAAIEYKAVVTPAERSQRQLAGLQINRPPPPHPFPHAPLKTITTTSIVAGQRDRVTERGKAVSSTHSLHAQHLAAITAILHRSMMRHDFHRASRALGLLLRNSVGGRPIDIRSNGLWGIGAEILLRRGGLDHDTGQEERNLSRTDVTQEGFQRAQAYYENLIVQFPLHKAWPNAINARQFCMALFGLWIFITNQNLSKVLRRVVDPDEAESDTEMTLLQIRLWELRQAQNIAEAMDSRMREATFHDDSELIRLRGMVALWSADLFELCFTLEDDEDVREAPGREEGGYRTDQVERVILADARTITRDLDSQGKEQREYLAKAQQARALARDLFDRLNSP